MKYWTMSDGCIRLQLRHTRCVANFLPFFSFSLLFYFLSCVLRRSWSALLLIMVNMLVSLLLFSMLCQTGRH